MNIQIQDINVQHLGPIVDFQMNLGRFNLIYGQNEHGKTYLVEFLLKTLFRSASGSDWRLRSLSPNGMVTVTGLEDNPVSFTPGKNRRLEDYWEEWNRGFPTNMARLLVVKGAELEMSPKAEGGISKSALKEFLSGEALLDYIQNRISATVQGASINSGAIDGHNKGEIKNQREIKVRIEKTDQLFGEVQELYSGGERSALSFELQELDEAMERLRKAKRNKAFQISRKIADLNRSLQNLPKDKLNELESAHSKFLHHSRQIEGLKDQAAKLRKSDEDYQWLKNAISVYSERGLASKPKANTLYLILGLLSFVISIMALLLDSSLFVALLMIIGIALTGLYIWQLRKQSEYSFDADELERIEREYEHRFSQDLTNLAGMKAQLEELEDPFRQSQVRKEEIKREEETLREVTEQILEILQDLCGDVYETEVWADKIRELREQRDQLEQQIDEQERVLLKLDVEPDDYLSEDSGEVYEKSKLEALEGKREDTEKQLSEQKSQLDELKQRICYETGDSITTEWEEIIQNLKEKREELVGEYRKTTADILGKIMVYRVLQEIREQEDEKIRTRLQASTVNQPLYDITNRYKSINLVQDQLMVADTYSEFHLSDLSTGAQEQVLLALRVGFAAQIMREECAFLILDDAFQHADWRRRECLMAEMVRLAKKGWQILYLTMDDHIKKLFDQAGSHIFGDEYRVKALGA